VSRAPLLTLSAAIEALDALRELHRVCLGMDLERQGDRPTEAEYQVAMARAEYALQGAKPVRAASASIPSFLTREAT
jgi:hypothetical protein